MSTLDRQRLPAMPPASNKPLAPGRRIDPGRPAGAQMPKSQLSPPPPKGRAQTGIKVRR